MFRELRRKNQGLEQSVCDEVLQKVSYGVLAVLGDDDYPYCVPLNYVYLPNQQIIYLHCAKTGHKIDAIRKHSKVSFCVVSKDQVIAEKFTTAFESVVAFGTACEVSEEQEKLFSLRQLNQKYSPEFEKTGEQEIEKFWNAVSIIKIEVQHISGKIGKELLAKNSTN